jgi:hypothetical protein
MGEAKPHPANAPGDYFVEDGCCLSCDVPFHYAPDLFAWFTDPRGGVHCYVKKQPETAVEADRMFEVIRQAEAGCIMYRGSDRAAQRRLVEAGEGPICLDLPADLQRRSAEVLADLEEQRRRSRSLLRRLMRWLQKRA